MRRHPVCTIITLLRAVTLLLVLLAPLAAWAQPLATADLAGDWFFSQVTAPTTAFTGTSIRSYRGNLTFTALGAASGTLVDDLAASFTVTGTLTLDARGLLDGTLTLAGPDTRTFDVREGPHSVRPAHRGRRGDGDAYLRSARRQRGAVHVRPPHRPDLQPS